MRIIWSLIVLLIIAATSIQPVNSYAEAFTVKAETPSIAPGRFIAVYIGDDSNRREPEIASRIVDAENLVEVLGGRVVKRFFLINGFIISNTCHADMNATIIDIDHNFLGIFSGFFG